MKRRRRVLGKQRPGRRRRGSMGARGLPFRSQCLLVRGIRQESGARQRVDSLCGSMFLRVPWRHSGTGIAQ